MRGRAHQSWTSSLTASRSPFKTLNKEKRGELVSREAVKQRIVREVRRVRDAFLKLPLPLAEEVAALGEDATEGQIGDVLTRRFKQTFTELSQGS